MSNTEDAMPDKVKEENDGADEVVANVESNSKEQSKDYQCDVCDYAAQSPTQLSQHQRSHTGDRPYTCDICGFAFTQKGNLTRHMKTHSDEKPYKCSICPYEARRRDALLAHMVTHTEDKRHVCQWCGMGYKQKASLREHMKKCRNQIGGKVDAKIARNVKSIMDREHKKRKSSTPKRNPDGAKLSRHEEDGGSLTDLTSNGIINLNDSTAMPQGVESAFNNVLAMYGHQIEDSPISPVTPAVYPPPDSNHVNHENNNNVIDYSIGHPGRDAPNTEHSDNISDSLEERSCPSEKENTATARQRFSWMQNTYDNEDERRSTSSSKSLCVRCHADTGLSVNYRCEHCQILFMDHVMYTIHMGCHGFHDPLECNICGFRSKDKYEFTSHLARGKHH
ncbi:DNA-binding protein Ikaros-like [Ptychodera flava]|uniref:DNA-binding protein Ikaros-like n=1 Tax=Ptychodera flava TaxID=63121 RepID=UPI00396A9D98